MRKPNWRSRLWLAPVAVVALGLAACSGTETPGAGASASPSPATATPGSSPATAGSPSAVSPVTTSATPAVEPSHVCADTQDWTTGPKSVTRDPVQVALYNARVGRHDCYDRIVFDINGAAQVGYSVQYVSAVHADPSDKVVSLPGSAFLQVTVAAPVQGADGGGHQPWRSPPQLGDNLVPAGQLGGLSVLKGVKFAGSFENVTTVGLGVESRLAFTVNVWRDGAYTHVIVDVAHPPAR